LWDSEKTASDRSVNVEYKGKLLESRKQYYWKVKWWDISGKSSPYSNVQVFESGLLNAEDWQAKWIGPGNLVRKSFTVDRQVHRARVYVCGLGYYELRINCIRVGGRQLDPGWTDYSKYSLYSTYDITSILKEGDNAVGVMLGKGRYATRNDASSADGSKTEGPVPKVILQIEIEYKDGNKVLIVSDDRWKMSHGPVIEDDIYNGEVYDARFEQTEWDYPGFDDSKWERVVLLSPPQGKLKSQATYPAIEAIDRLSAKSLNSPSSGVYVYDFGQNFSGWVKLRSEGPRGTKIRLRHAELLDRDGMINSGTNKNAKATDTYVRKGDGVETYQPRFTYHGFRYVEAMGFSYTPSLNDIEGIVVHSAVKPVGGFACSNTLINSIHRNVLWAQLSNLMSIPTDCPQRDERLGWMGDAQLTVETAMYNFDMSGFYLKWLQDIRESQRPDGSVPDIVPPHWPLYPADPAWGTACVTIPWHLYLFYDDLRVLEENYDMLKHWLDFLGNNTENYIVNYSRFGDWCSPGHLNSHDTSGKLISTWYYFQNLITLSEIAGIIGKTDDAKECIKLAGKVKEAFNQEFLHGDWYDQGSQTSNILPLYAEMVPEEKKETVLRKLIENIVVNHDCHVGTGIVGTRYILDTLTKYGQAELAYRLVTQRTYPGWGYMINEGATTLWERWEYLAGAGINSHNHYMFGSVDAWFYKVLAGINVDAAYPGFRRIIIRPYPVGELLHASASVHTVRGLVCSSWQKDRDSFTLNVEIPVNSGAYLSLPASLNWHSPIVREGGEVIFKGAAFIPGHPGVNSGVAEEQFIKFEIGSGSFTFQITDDR